MQNQTKQQQHKITKNVATTQDERAANSLSSQEKGSAAHVRQGASTSPPPRALPFFCCPSPLPTTTTLGTCRPHASDTPLLQLLLGPPNQAQALFPPFFAAKEKSEKRARFHPRCQRPKTALSWFSNFRNKKFPIVCPVVVRISYFTEGVMHNQGKQVTEADTHVLLWPGFSFSWFSAFSS
jgi:hypothetical protein